MPLLAGQWRELITSWRRSLQQSSGSHVGCVRGVTWKWRRGQGGMFRGQPQLGPGQLEGRGAPGGWEGGCARRVRHGSGQAAVTLPVEHLLAWTVCPQGTLGDVWDAVVVTLGKLLASVGWGQGGCSAPTVPRTQNEPRE